MTEKEKELFFELCNFENPDGDKIKSLIQDYTTPSVLGYLFYNRMQSIAYGVLNEYGLLSSVNREFRNSLAEAYGSNISRNTDYFYCLDYLSIILKNVKCGFAMLKGALLCGVYPEGYRTSNDIDLLVNPKDVTEISKCLLKAGFKQGNIRNDVFIPATRREIIESKITRGETVPFVMELNLPKIKYLEVDVNFSLDYKHTETTVLNKMLDNVADVDSGSNTIKTLNKYDFFIHLCCHLYKEATTLPWIDMKRDMTLYKYCDIYLLLESFNSNDIENLFSYAKEYELQDICGSAIIWTSELFKLKNNYALQLARKSLTDASIPNIVISPSENKQYIYTVNNAKERFFCDNRKDLLKEVK